jgi:hypothetical protein
VWPREVLPYPLLEAVNPIGGILSTLKVSHPKNAGNGIHNPLEAAYKQDRDTRTGSDVKALGRVANTVNEDGLG